ncbi:hypothetical protein DL98DRAFT_614165 [Cadophora sp. DSE1049]|nr:hypothetical protein DL98DRAFT_614165 [Cadophora sp. DSE1049]
MALVPQHLTADEEAQIHRQFQGDTWQRNNQVLWSGILREEAQLWADEHEMQTLTTAMGPLMDPSHPLCLWTQKTATHGAILSPPPPERFHPSGQTNYQLIEEPIVKGSLGTTAVSRIELVHPTVPGAENTSYQIWPVDDTTTWTKQFGELHKAVSNIVGGMEIAREEKEKGNTKAKMIVDNSKQKKGKEKAKEKGKAKKKEEEEEAKIAKKEVIAILNIQVEELKGKKKKGENVKKEDKVKGKTEKKKSKKEKKKDKVDVKVKEEDKSKEKEIMKTKKVKKEINKARKAKKLKKERKKKLVTREGQNPEVGNERVGMVVIRGDFLIGLMLVMVLVPEENASLSAASVCVFAFGIVASWF